MKALILALGISLSGIAAQAQRASDPALLPRHQLAAAAELATHGAEPNETELLSHRNYKAKDGHEVHSPANAAHDQVPAGASAKCRDGSYSFSQYRQGTCSHHGGVGLWL
jgi:hypothetical protein